MPWKYISFTKDWVLGDEKIGAGFPDAILIS
jgi:hypothetical protein